MRTNAIFFILVQKKIQFHERIWISAANAYELTYSISLLTSATHKSLFKREISEICS